MCAGTAVARRGDVRERRCGAVLDLDATCSVVVERAVGHRGSARDVAQVPAQDGVTTGIDVVRGDGTADGEKLRAITRHAVIEGAVADRNVAGDETNVGVGRLIAAGVDRVNRHVAANVADYDAVITVAVEGSDAVQDRYRTSHVHD